MRYAILICALVLSGCVVRSFPVTKDRVDQDLTVGNRGYLTGEAPPAPERKPTRRTQVVEIELHPLLKFERVPKHVKEPVQESEAMAGEEVTSEGAPVVSMPSEVYFEKYTVQKNDTLQKISQKFYGTTKKWSKIYEANKGVLKGPNRIYPGQVINIPFEDKGGAAQSIK